MSVGRQDQDWGLCFRKRGMSAVPMGLRWLNFQVILSVGERMRAAVLGRVNGGRVQRACGGR